MGLIQSRRNVRTPVVANSTSSSYKYPPKSEKYFTSHFIMGGERFECAKPDAYLFGENEDLNFLGGKPAPFPYPVPQPHEPTKTLRSLVNIRRDSVRFAKDADDASQSSGHDNSHTRYNVEFTFDTDVKCAITIYYFAKEEISNKYAIYRPRDPSMNSDTFHYKRGANQTFSQPTHFVYPSQFTEEDWKYNPDSEVIPVVIHCVVEETEHIGHSHMTFAVVERSMDGGFVLKALKQKQMVDGLCYLLQEIYGIENKNAQRVRAQEDDTEDNGSECVICMCEMRDTLILPCRHLCLCNSCADNLRYQANNCPICRAKFHALLQIKAMVKKPNPTSTGSGQQVEQPNETSDDVGQDGIPAGYEAVSLIEALNGPTQPHCACSVPTLPTTGTAQSLQNRTPDDVVSSEDSLPKENGAVADVASSEQEAVNDEKEQVAEEDLPDYDDDDDVDDTNGNTNTIYHPLQITSSKKEGECKETVISIANEDDEDLEQMNSSYATPLHQSRVALKNPTPTHESRQNSQPTIEGKSQTTDDDSQDSRYSSSLSTKYLLEHGPENEMYDTKVSGTTGSEKHVHISIA